MRHQRKNTQPSVESNKDNVNNIPSTNSTDNTVPPKKKRVAKPKATVDNTVNNTSTTTPTTLLDVYNITILDASGSMHGGKYNNACTGIKKEIETLAKDTNANHYYTLIEFANSRIWHHDSTKIHEVNYTHFTNKKVKDVGSINFKGATGGTPLYRTLNEVLLGLKINPPIGKCILKVFTDGEDTDNWPITYKRDLSNVIKESEDRGITTTFMATEYDKQKIMRELNISSDNILVHDNTAEGTTRGFMRSTTASMLYAKSMSKGASGSSLTSNFFSRTEDDAERGL